jgi:hypothetical protein
MLDMGLTPLTNPEQTWRGVHRILSVLGKTASDPHITFFTTGQIARQQTDLVREIAGLGHEIACHSDQHENVYTLSRAGFLKNLARSKAALEEASGQRIIGYRAPNFSIDQRSGWAYPALIEAGFVYDSSMVNGNPRTDSRAYDVMEFGGLQLFELPVYWHRITRKHGIRVIGGTYFRLLPICLIVALMKQAIARGYIPLIYLHAADADDRPSPVRWHEMRELTCLARSRWVIRQKQWSIGSASVVDKLREVLKTFPSLGPMRTALPL